MDIQYLDSNESDYFSVDGEVYGVSCEDGNICDSEGVPINKAWQSLNWQLVQLLHVYACHLHNEDYLTKGWTV